MNKVYGFSFSFSIIFFASCSGVKIQSDYDRQADFTQYKSYTVCASDEENSETQSALLYDNSLNRSRIKKSIEKELNELGYVRDDENPDLLAGFKIIIKDRNVMTTQCYDFAEYQYWPECRVNAYYYTEGTLVIYITDISKNQIVWQGSAEGVLDIPQEKMEKVIDKTVSEIFKKFPPKEDTPRKLFSEKKPKY